MGSFWHYRKIHGGITMKSAEQIKGAVKNIAKKMNLKPQEVLQIFMFERLVERFKRGGSGNSNQKRLFRRTDRI